jgi:hypothetical protein
MQRFNNRKFVAVVTGNCIPTINKPRAYKTVRIDAIRMKGPKIMILERWQRKVQATDSVVKQTTINNTIIMFLDIIFSSFV